MAIFKLEKRLPSYSLTKVVLVELGNYLETLHELFSVDAQPASFKIRGRDWREEFEQVGDYSREFFPNDTEEITFEWGYFTPRCQVKITFSRNASESVLSIDLYQERAREKANSISNSVLEILEPYRNLRYFLHPSWPGAAILAILFFGPLPLLAIGQQWALYVMPAGFTLPFAYIACWEFVSYNAFPSARTKRRTGVMKYVGLLLLAITAGWMAKVLFDHFFGKGPGP